LKRRLFVAADVDDVTRAACARVAEQLRAKGWSGRWFAPENYHLTVAFIGYVGEEHITDVAAAVGEIAPRIPALDVPLDTVGAFPNQPRPRTAWAGSGASVPAFGTLCGVVRSKLTTLGLTFDANPEPHVTLARADRSTIAGLPQVEAPIARLRIEALTLYESVTERTGARYEAIERFPLRG